MDLQRLVNGNPVENSIRSATSRLPLGKRPDFYVAGIIGVLIVNVLTALVDSQLLSDCLILGSIILIGIVFACLFNTFACRKRVRGVLFLAVLSLASGQVLSITEEITSLAELPILGNLSAWNSFFTTLGMVTGLVLILCALILAVIDLGVARDVLKTEVGVRRATELALANHRDHLEDEIKARTASLEQAQEELLGAERLAALGEIMSTVSHELRNPLGTLSASLFTIRKGIEKDDPVRVQNAMGRCMRSILRCDHIIEELHEFSHLEKLQRRSTSVDDWLADFVGSTTVPDFVRFDTNFQSNAILALDADSMGRALFHLISNSVNAFENQEDQENRLIVSSLRYAHACRIQIQDTGSGMTPDVLAQVSEPLFSTRAFGAGLGVPIAEETIRRHGGTVHYESEVNKGTTVTIELPLCAE